MKTINKYIKAFSLIEKEQKHYLHILFFLMFIAYFLETLSVGLIIPMLVFLSGNETNEVSNFINQISFFKGLTSIEKIRFFVLIFLFVYVIKNFYLILFRWYQENFISKVNINLSTKLYNHYLKQPYLFFVKNKSATLIKNVTTETFIFTTHIIDRFVNLILEFIVLITISIILFLFNPKIFLFVAILSVVTFFIFSLLSRKMLIKWSEDRALYEGKIINKLQVAFNLSKILKIYLKDNKYNQIFENYTQKYFHTIRNRNVLAKFPRYLFEIIAIISLVFIVLYQTENNNDSNEIIILLGLFAGAAYRMFPAIINISISLQTLRFGLPAAKILLSELRLKSLKKSGPDNNKVLKFKKKISLKDISFKYPNTKNKVLKNINLDIKKKDIIGIAGTSGSGKTTLIDILSGILKPSTGSINIDGQKLKNDQTNQWMKNFGYVPQGVFLVDDTIEKNITLGNSGKKIDTKKLISVSKQAQIHSYIQSLPNKYKTKINEKGTNFSEGQKQRLAIARALYNNPEILLLDEPTSALDVTTEKNFVKALKLLRNKKTIIIIAHRYSILQFCRKVYVFDFNNNFKKINKKYIKQIC